ncbi:hypothetical protein PVAP13_5KG216721 [Panicum virgatum]|uniref:Uncharacterized protein n=1 Tax=Panicum virgatum TaxID=38727 RepID=A0A8T0SJ11_PANVG|nr:hypothetical protein PVAP13_5KG216721 [Panicum virgatum]
MIIAHPQIKAVAQRPFHGRRSHAADTLPSPSPGDRRAPPGHRASVPPAGLPSLRATLAGLEDAASLRAPCGLLDPARLPPFTAPAGVEDVASLRVAAGLHKPPEHRRLTTRRSTGPQSPAPSPGGHTGQGFGRGYLKRKRCN